MSRIWDALRKAERDKNRKIQTGDAQTQDDPLPQPLSTKCSLANAPVLVYGYGTTNDPFHERAEAFSVDARGGRLTLTTAVNPGQTLLLTNEVNMKEEECIVREVSVDSCAIRIVFEFLQPARDFWEGC